MDEILHESIVKRWADVELLSELILKLIPLAYLDLFIGIFLIILFVRINNVFNKFALIFYRKMMHFVSAFFDEDLVLLTEDVSVRLSHIYFVKENLILRILSL